MSTELKESLLQQYTSLESQANADVLKELRKDAITNFQVQGFPTTKHEEWKYTNLKSIVARPYSIQPAAAVNAADIASLTDISIDAHKVIFVNGVYNAALSDATAEGIEISTFNQSNKTIADTYFGKRLPYSDSMLSLNLAFAQQGTLIQIKAKQTIDKPILCYFISDARSADVLIQPAVLIVAEEASSATIIEVQRTLGTHVAFTNTFSHAILKKDAYLEHYNVQNDSDKSIQIHNTQILHEAKSVSYSMTVTLKGALVRNNMNITLDAEYCEAHLNGLYLENGSQHVDNHTLVDHAKPNCYSNELYKGILDGKSTGVFNGKIWVRKDAQKTNAFQSNKNILLSKDASVNTKPQLEIFADDVKCSHGATTGQLDEAALFYLRARGVGLETTKRLLVHAIAFDVLDKVKNDGLKAYLEQEIETRLK